MAFNISNFKENITDMLRPHSYVVKVTPPYGGLNSQQLSLRTRSISVPGVSFAEVDNYKIYGSGLQISVPHTTTIQEISCRHYVDAGGSILQTFYDWTNNIVDIGGEGKYSPNYYNEYTVDMTIEMYDLQNIKVKTYELRNAFPKSVEPIDLSWDSTEVMELGVTYNFESFTIS